MGLFNSKPATSTSNALPEPAAIEVDSANLSSTPTSSTTSGEEATSGCLSCCKPKLPCTMLLLNMKGSQQVKMIMHRNLSRRKESYLRTLANPWNVDQSSMDWAAAVNFARHETSWFDVPRRRMGSEEFFVPSHCEVKRFIVLTL